MSCVCISLRDPSVFQLSKFHRSMKCNDIYIFCYPPPPPPSSVFFFLNCLSPYLWLFSSLIPPVLAFSPSPTPVLLYLSAFCQSLHPAFHLSIFLCFWSISDSLSRTYLNPFLYTHTSSYHIFHCLLLTF